MKVEKQYSAGENYETSFKTIGKDSKSVQYFDYNISISLKLEKREKNLLSKMCQAQDHIQIRQRI